MRIRAQRVSAPSPFYRAASPGTQSKPVTPKPMNELTPATKMNPVFQQKQRQGVSGTCFASTLQVPAGQERASECCILRKRCLLIGVNYTKDFLTPQVCFPLPPDVNLGFLTVALLVLKNLSHGLAWPLSSLLLLGTTGQYSSTLTIAMALSGNINFLVIEFPTRDDFAIKISESPHAF